MTEEKGHQAPELLDWRRKGLARLKWTLIGYGVAWMLLVTSAMLGLAPMGPVLAVVGLGSAAWLVFWGLVRKGHIGPAYDPLWVFPQICVGYLMVAMAFVYVPWTRTVASAWLFLIVLFDLRRLNRMQVWAVALLSITFPIGSLWVHALSAGSDFVLAHELVFMTLSLTLIPSLIYINAVARRLNVRLKSQQGQMAQVLARLKRLSSLDALTGLYNRAAMQRILRREVMRSHRNQLPFTLAMVDLDHFKLINDTYGHAVGDEVLRQFGELAKRCARSRTDVMARWGGEEFLLFMPATTEVEAQACVARLREGVLRHPWFRLHPQLVVTFSAGVAQHNVSDGLDMTLNKADAALYRAKDQGRDRSVLASGQEVVSLPPAALAILPASSPVIPPTAPPKQRRPSDVDNGWFLTPTAQAAAHPVASVQAKVVKVGLAGWRRWLFGVDESLHPWMQLSLIASGLYVSLIVAIVFYGVPSGLVDQQWAHTFVAADMLAAVLPLAIIRSGWARKWNDPGLTLLQIMWGCGLTALAFVVVPASRAYDLQLLCVILAFGMTHLRPRQAIFAGGFVTLIFMGIYMKQTHHAMSASDDLSMRLQLLMAAALVWLLTLHMHHSCLIREGVANEKLRLLAGMEKLRQAIKFDPLTQLYNRPHMEAMMEDEAHRHDRTGLGFCVVLIDLDHFKGINDQWGHQAGDGVLKRFAACAKEVLRETDTIGRWGGEEFVLLVPDTASGPQGWRAVERLRQAVMRQSLCKQSPKLVVTFSAGVASRQPGEPISTALERADGALYAAKHQGRNCCVLSQV